MEKVREVNREVAGLESVGRLHFLDAGARFLGPDGEIQSACVPDRLHLVRPGYEIWALALEPLLAPILS